MFDQFEEEFAEANLLLSDVEDEDDRTSSDFAAELTEAREAVERVRSEYERALASLPEHDQAGMRKKYELGVVGLRDRLGALDS